MTRDRLRTLLAWTVAWALVLVVVPALLLASAALLVPPLAQAAASVTYLVRSSAPTFTNGTYKEPWITTAGRLATDVTVSAYAAPLDVVGGGAEATALRVTVANDSTGVLTVDSAQLPAALGQAAMAGSVSVALASDDAATASLAVLDDWDESDRAKVNVIAGQAGVTAGAGAVAANTPRVTLASNDPAVATLGATTGAKVISDADGSLQQYLRGIVYNEVAPLSVSVSASLSADAQMYPATGGLLLYGLAVTEAAGTAAAAEVILYQGTSAVASKQILPPITLAANESMRELVFHGPVDLSEGLFIDVVSGTVIVGCMTRQ